MQMWGIVARFIFTCIYIIQINKYNVGNQAEFKVKFGNQTEPKTETGGGGIPPPPLPPPPVASAPPLSPDEIYLASAPPQLPELVNQIAMVAHNNYVSISILNHAYEQLKASVEHNDASLGRLYARLFPKEQV